MKEQTSTRRQTLTVIVCVSIGLLAALLLAMAVISAQSRAKEGVGEGDTTTPMTSDRANTPSDTSNYDGGNVERDSDTDAAQLFEPLDEVAEDIEVDSPLANNAEASDSDSAVGIDDAPSDTEGSAEPIAPKNTIPTFAAPTSGSISKTHDDDLLVYSMTMNDYRVHLGVDIACAEGAPVTACADGVICAIEEELFMGHTIAIDHGNGFVSYCKNLAATLPDDIAVGTAVKSGQLIGAVGDSALAEIADQPHLHFELERDGVNLDPSDYIKFPSDTDYSEGLQ